MCHVCVYCAGTSSKIDKFNILRTIIVHARLHCRAIVKTWWFVPCHVEQHKEECQDSAQLDWTHCTGLEIWAWWCRDGVAGLLRCTSQRLMQSRRVHVAFTGPDGQGREQTLAHSRTAYIALAAASRCARAEPGSQALCSVCASLVLRCTLRFLIVGPVQCAQIPILQ
jgi:hypothetical protein